MSTYEPLRWHGDRHTVQDRKSSPMHTYGSTQWSAGRSWADLRYVAAMSVVVSMQLSV